MTSRARRNLISALVALYIALLTGIPFLAAALPVLWLRGTVTTALALFLSPVLFGFTYIAVAGGLSRLTRRAMIAGKFPRDLGHEVYGPRRLWALCWTAVYYCTPLYHGILAVPALKRFTFRLFGYRGSLAITLYPDTWIRDLPLLEVEDGAYLSNRATIGTNMCMQDGTVIVAPVRIGKGAMVGHLAMLAPGVAIGERAEIGVGCAIGLKARIGARARIAPCTTVNHGASVGADCDIGTQCLVGMRAVLHDGVRIPAGTVVPPRLELRNQGDVRSLLARTSDSREGAVRIGA